MTDSEESSKTASSGGKRVIPIVKSLYTVKEVAEILGFDDETIRRWCKEGRRFPNASQKLGNRWRIPYGDLKQVLNEFDG